MDVQDAGADSVISPRDCALTIGITYFLSALLSLVMKNLIGRRRLMLISLLGKVFIVYHLVHYLCHPVLKFIFPLSAYQVKLFDLYQSRAKLTTVELQTIVLLFVVISAGGD